MSFLKTLTFSTANDLAPSPIEKKRHQLMAALKDQLTLLGQPDLTKSRRKWIEVEGKRTLTLKDIPVRPWWKQTLDGKVMFFVRSGLRQIEFEKGKSAILLSSVDDLPKLINALMDAAMIAELDHLLVGKVKPSPTPRQKAA
jgi:hypothetical protein